MEILITDPNGEGKVNLTGEFASVLLPLIFHHMTELIKPTKKGDKIYRMDEQYMVDIKHPYVPLSNNDKEGKLTLIINKNDNLLITK